GRYLQSHKQYRTMRRRQSLHDERYLLRRDVHGHGSRRLSRWLRLPVLANESWLQSERSNRAVYHVLRRAYRGRSVVRYIRQSVLWGVRRWLHVLSAIPGSNLGEGRLVLLDIRRMQGTRSVLSRLLEHQLRPSIMQLRLSHQTRTLCVLERVVW